MLQLTVERALTLAPNPTKLSITETCPWLAATCKGAHLFYNTYVCMVK